MQILRGDVSVDFPGICTFGQFYDTSAIVFLIPILRDNVSLDLSASFLEVLKVHLLLTDRCLPDICQRERGKQSCSMETALLGHWYGVFQQREVCRDQLDGDVVGEAQVGGDGFICLSVGVNTVQLIVSPFWNGHVLIKLRQEVCSVYWLKSSITLLVLEHTIVPAHS